MVVIEQCRIDDEGKYFILDAVIEDIALYKDTYIESIIIDTQDTYSPNGPNNEPIRSFDKVKRVSLRIPAGELIGVSLNTDILFVYIKAIDSSAIDYSYETDNEYTIGIAVNLRPIYNMSMLYIKELNNNRSIPKGFVDMILKLKAFELSLKTGNYREAINYWSVLLKASTCISSSKKA